MATVKLSTKLYTGFALMIVLLMALTSIVLRNLTILKQDTPLLADAARCEQVLGKFETGMQEKMRRIDAFIEAPDENKLQHDTLSEQDEHPLKNPVLQQFGARDATVASQFQNLMDQYNIFIQNAERLVDGGGNAVPGQTAAMDVTRAFEGTIEKLHQTQEHIISLRTTAEHSLHTRFLWIQWTVGSVTLFGISTGIILLVMVRRQIMTPVNMVIAGLTRSSETAKSASHHMSSSSNTIALASNKHAASLEEISASIKEMAATSDDNAANTRNVTSMLNSSRAAAEKSTGAIARLDEAIAQIKSSSEETGKIMKTIDEIAFQTNLLALNAAVEAARAGEAGKGFAVVAEEVRNLAQRSAEASRNTAELIKDSQKSAENGVTVSQEVDAITREIIESITKVTDLMADVSRVNDSQAQGTSQISSSVSQMEDITQATAASSEELVGSSNELESQAKDLSTMVQVLKNIVGSNNRPTPVAGKPALPSIPSGSGKNIFQRLKGLLPHRTSRAS